MAMLSQSQQSRLAGEKLPRTSLGSIWTAWGKGEPTAHTQGHLGNEATALTQQIPPAKWGKCRGWSCQGYPQPPANTQKPWGMVVPWVVWGQ